MCKRCHTIVFLATSSIGLLVNHMQNFTYFKLFVHNLELLKGILNYMLTGGLIKLLNLISFWYHVLMGAMRL